jgi:hypothetical protein
MKPRGIAFPPLNVSDERPGEKGGQARVSPASWPKSAFDGDGTVPFDAIWLTRFRVALVQSF